MPSQEIIIIIGCLLLWLFSMALVVILMRHFHKSKSDKMLEYIQTNWSQLITQQDNRWGHLSGQMGTLLENLNTSMNERLNQNHLLTQKMQSAVAERLDQAGKTTAELRGQLGELNQATQRIIQVGSEVRKLQDILQRPAIRGGLGEWSLENLLREVLPQDHYSMQHQFKNGSRVDALVHLAQGHIAIDAKFPLSNFEQMLTEHDETARARLRKAFLKDVRSRIDEIADKYILPDEGTLDFAIMYIPAENVFYETIIADGSKDLDVNVYARSRKVVPASPNTLYAYLMVVVMGLKGLQIEKNAQFIRRRLNHLRSDIESIYSEFNLTGKHLNNARQKYDDTGRKLDQFRGSLEQVETLSTESPR